MRFKIMVLVFGLVFSGTNPSFANEGSTGWRTILNYGCHLGDGTCFVNIDGYSVGPTQCNSTSVRWDVKNSPNGKEWLALISAAHAAGHKINLYIYGCYTSQPSYPTFAWGSVMK